MILLKNCFYIYTMDNGKFYKDYDILIKGNIIHKIEKNIDINLIKKNMNEEIDIIDARNLVVVPGFVNTHHHFYQTLTRNLKPVQNAKLFDWLVYLYEIWKNIDREAVFYSSLTAIGELLKTGCTLTTDHHYLYPENFEGDLMATQFEAARLLGIRFSPTRGSMSLSKKDGGLPPDSVVQTEDEILKDSLRVIEHFHDNSDFSMSKVVLAPCSPFSVTRDLMIESARLARNYNVKLHTHLAETEDETQYCVDTFGKRPLDLMEEWEFVGEDVFYAHGIYFNDNELKRLKDTGTSIAHCPSSNMRLGSGIARVTEMLEMGINVGLAVDGSASNDTSDFLGEMRNAMLLQRVRYGAKAMKTEDVYKIAIENGAKILGFNKVGKIKEEWAADLALFNINKLEYVGTLSDPAAALIFAGIDHKTEYTIVNGKIVVEHGKLKGFDEDEIIKKGNEIASKILNK